MSTELVTIALQRLDDDDLRELNDEISEAVAEVPVDTERLGNLAWQALERSNRSDVLAKGAYESLYWLVEDALITAHNAGQQG